MRLHHVQVPAGATTQQVVGGAGRLYYVASYETTGSATAAFRLVDGDSVSDRIVYPCNLAANESTRDWFGPHGLPFATNLTFVAGGGSLVVALYYASEFEAQQREVELAHMLGGG